MSTAIKKIYELKASLTPIKDATDELECHRDELDRNYNFQNQLIREFKNLRSVISEVSAIAQHLPSNNEVQVANLEFQQEANVILNQLTGLQELMPMSLKPVTSKNPSQNQTDQSDLGEAEKERKRITVAGWLRKKGERAISNSHRRYFYLDPSAPTELRYYENDTMTKMKGFIALDQMTSVLTGETDKTMFAIETPSRQWVLQADTERDAKVWVRMLSKWGEGYQLAQKRKARKNALLEVEKSMASTSSLVNPSSSSQDSDKSDPRTWGSSDTNPISEEAINAHLLAEQMEQFRQEEQKKRFAEKFALRQQREIAEKQRHLSESQQSLEKNQHNDVSGSNSSTSSADSQAFFSSLRSSSLTQSNSANLLGNGVNSGSLDPTDPGYAGSLSSLESPRSNSATLIRSNIRTTSSALNISQSLPLVSPAVLRDKLRVALKQRRDKSVAISELERQKKVFQALKSEKKEEIKKMEDEDPVIKQLRQRLEETQSLHQHLKESIATYESQIIEHNKLLSLIQQSITAEIEKSSMLTAQIDDAKVQLDALGDKSTTISQKLSSISLQRTVSYGMLSPAEQWEEKMKVLSEATNALRELENLMEIEMERKRQAQYAIDSAFNSEYEEQIRKSDSTRMKFQHFRAIMNTDQGYHITDELEELKHDYFVAITNGIKLAIIQEGHTLKFTPPSSMYAEAVSEQIPFYQWPQWISNYLRSMSVENRSETNGNGTPVIGDGGVKNSTQNGGHSGENGTNGSEFYDEDESLEIRRVRARRRNNVRFGANLGGNLGGGLVMM